MSNQRPPKPAQPPGTIDFEVTDFDSARQALDDLPAGVAEVRHMRPGYWDQQRRKAVPTDRALSGAAMDWVVSLPPALRPHATCEHFPRVANEIASSWSDTANNLRVLGVMINDYRGGRRGFPVEVQRELNALLEYLRGSASR